MHSVYYYSETKKCHKQTDGSAVGRIMQELSTEFNTFRPGTEKT